MDKLVFTRKTMKLQNFVFVYLHFVVKKKKAHLFVDTSKDEITCQKWRNVSVRSNFVRHK